MSQPSIINLPELLRGCLRSIAAGVLAGCASALFLVSLDWVTSFRETHLWLIALLPLCGLGIGWFYSRYGRAVEAGTNLIIDEIHDPKSVVPLRMTPLVLGGTLLTHLFGGSAGREGTAVQMGASLADQLSRSRFADASLRPILLMAGMSAGFSSVFGTPWAGTLFGLEVLAVGGLRLRLDALLPCALSAFVAHGVTLAWGVHHAFYPIGEVPRLSLAGAAFALGCGAIFGLCGRAFAGLAHGIQQGFKRLTPHAPLRPFLGGIVVALAVAALGSARYIGLGIPVIVETFHGHVPPWDFLLKLLFTAVTLGSGFKGGEVTPLFFMGATLGNALSRLLSLPSPLLSGMGFVAVFAGAANTPLSSTLMAIELFGPQAGLYAGLACAASFLVSGHPGIYRAQRLHRPKHRVFFP